MMDVSKAILGIMELRDDDFDLLLKALEAYKSHDFAGEMITDMMETMLFDKDVSRMSDEEKLQYEARKATSKMKKEEERKQKDEAKKVLSRKIDLLKARLILMAEAGVAMVA